MRIDEVRNEYRKNRDEMWRKVGTKCRYCGKKATELHHLIPISLGGDNRIENIIPLCHKHHVMAHRKLPHGDSKRGAKRKERPQNFEIVVERYLTRKIYLNEVVAELGIGRTTFYRMLHEYYEETGELRRPQPNKCGKPMKRKE